MTSTRAILFDFDGVLADTFEFCYEIIKSIDPALTREEYRARFLGNINEHKPERKIERPADFDFFALYTPKLLQVKIDPEAEKVILELSKKYPLFIVSSTNTDPIKKFLEQNKLDHCFKEVYGNDVHKSKIEKIRMILDKYALDPAHCLFITDTLGDIREARKCNMNSMAVSWGYHSDETLQQGNPVAVVDSLKDLVAAIDKNFGNDPIMPNYFCMSCGKEYSDLKIKSNWFLVRHGETDWNKGEKDRNKIDRIQGSSDTHLNENGRAQAKATAELLKDKHIDLIISSDLARAKQTAEIIAATTGAELIFDKSLREMDFGRLEGMPIPEVNEKYGGFLDRPYKELGGEIFEEVEERAMKALHNHRKDHEHKNVVIVSHGALLGLVIKNIRKIDHAKSSGLKIENAEAIKLEIGEPCDSCGGDLYESASR